MRARRAYAAIALIAALLALCACTPSKGEARTAASTSSSPPSPEELYRPYVVYDPKEEFYATDRAALVEHPDAVLRHAGRTVASGSGVPQRLSVKLLDERLDPVYSHDTVSVAEDYDGWKARRADAERHGHVMYPRTVRGSDGRLWLQYWFFYVFNDSAPFGGGFVGGAFDHEGDWESLHVRLDEQGRLPEIVIASQHKGWQVVPWPQVHLIDGRPVIYPGRGTHAIMLAPGCHLADESILPDCNHGDRRRALEPTPRAFDAPQFPGRYGAIAAPSTKDEYADPAVLLSR